MAGSLVRNFDKKVFKKCIKCRNWKRRKDLEDDDGNLLEKHGFGTHASSSDGLQSICFDCKNVANVKSRERNVTARIRHHTGTRCLTQLGKDLAPKNFVANLEDYLGYRIVTLVRHLGADLKEREGRKRKLRDALNEGWHVDHKKPLSSFKVIRKNQAQEDVVDWDAFRRCWAIENLRVISAEENLAKGSRYEEAPTPTGAP
ncbi:hypothetical protein LCGC14_1101670 [marine sediment metagenome]|uniref:Uncharacterized protein n=1 Tax=marine sediment metagenome TaxID=412755 RepID=A0A0F9M993_9ZZZZ